jgi:TM2 domain-containing membrane protein YozV
MQEQAKFCPSCGKPLNEGSAFCPACGTSVAMVGAPQKVVYVQEARGKDKTVAGLLGIFLGGLGIHKFYLGKPIQGIFYILFCWTLIPALLGFIEGIIYLASSEAGFNKAYNR